MIESLVLNSKTYLYSEIKDKPLSFFSLKTDFEKSTLQFCKDWLNNGQEFNINTSGSTGKPKEIIITRNQMITSAEMTAEFFNLKENDTILVNLNTKYIAGMMMLARGLHLNLSISIVEPSSNPLKHINIKDDFYAFVPLQMQSIIESNNIDFLKNAKAIIIGGAPISAYQEELFIKTELPIYSTYGMTETCTHIAIRKVGEHNFKGLKNVYFDIDKRNCLTINSPTAIENPLITNDVIDLISNQEFIWKGRFDNIINSGGVKIQVEQLESKIESLLNTLNQNTRFIISSKPDDKLGSKIILIAENEIDKAFIEKNLESYERPKEYFIVSNFPETATGKIDRKKLLIMV